MNAVLGRINSISGSMKALSEKMTGLRVNVVSEVFPQ